jgi:hypothetical protein
MGFEEILLDIQIQIKIRIFGQKTVFYITTTRRSIFQVVFPTETTFDPIAAKIAFKIRAMVTQIVSQ